MNAAPSVHREMIEATIAALDELAGIYRERVGAVQSPEARLVAATALHSFTSIADTLRKGLART